ncbi:YlbF family regulator [Halopenitus persicus]|uniref:YlbF family regulator n=1 Tax=Halopenitus persicus TaxID=1048396 RepID=UPI000BBAF760|nr:YlbF family regulator [Halopenitus persicus]
MSAEAITVEDLGRQLGDRITQLSEYERFEEARTAVENDDAVQEKIDEFEGLRQEFMAAQQTGQATQTGLNEVQRVQEELHSMPKMAEYLDAQEALTDRLEAVNQAISEPLSVDFGGEAGGCCHD